MQPVVNAFLEMKTSIHRLNNKCIGHSSQVFSAHAEGGPQTKVSPATLTDSPPSPTEQAIQEMCVHAGLS